MCLCDAQIAGRISFTELERFLQEFSDEVRRKRKKAAAAALAAAATREGFVFELSGRRKERGGMGAKVRRFFVLAACHFIGSWLTSV